MSTLLEVEKLAFDLPESQRATLAAHLLESLPPVLHDEDAGLAEALLRDGELDGNPDMGLSLEELDHRIARRPAFFIPASTYRYISDPAAWQKEIRETLGALRVLRTETGMTSPVFDSRRSLGFASALCVSLLVANGISYPFPSLSECHSHHTHWLY